MKKRTITFKIGGLRGGMEGHADVTEYETVDEALERLGDVKALEYLNYAQSLHDRSDARKKFYMAHAGPNDRGRMR